MAKNSRIAIRVTPEEKREIEEASDGNISEYLIGLHNSRFRIIDPKMLREFAFNIFNEEYARKFLREHDGRRVRRRGTDE